MLALSACNAKQTTIIPGKKSPTTHQHTLQPVTSQQIESGPISYVAMGASDAVGVGSDQPDKQGYVPLIASHLPQGSRLINLGISGIQLHDALVRELPLALATRPQLITIWLNANDFVDGVSYDSYMQDLNTMLQQLRANTKSRIVMANLPDMTLLPLYAHRSAAKKAQVQQEIQRWNMQIARLAQKYNVTLVDLYKSDSQITTHPDYISKDGFHPSAAGYAQLANDFWAAIDNPNT